MGAKESFTEELTFELDTKESTGVQQEPRHSGQTVLQGRRTQVSSGQEGLCGWGDRGIAAGNIEPLLSSPISSWPPPPYTTALYQSPYGLSKEPSSFPTHPLPS